MLFQTTQAHEELRAKERPCVCGGGSNPSRSCWTSRTSSRTRPSGLGEMGLMSILPRGGTAAPGAGCPELRHRRGGAGRVDGGAGVILSAHALRPGPSSPTAPRSRSASTWCPGQGREDRRLRPGPTPDPTPAALRPPPSEGRPLCPQRRQNLHHQRPKADTYVVFAVTTPDISAPGHRAFIVEKAGRATSATTTTKWASAPPLPS